MTASLRHRLGALAYDWPRFLRHIRGDWTQIRNRAEAIESDGRGARCLWEFGSDLHIANVYPSAGRWLLQRALADHPIALRDVPSAAGDERPLVSFVIGHRGRERAANLLATLRSIGGQTDVPIECVVVEQSAQPEVEGDLPGWVQYVHSPVVWEREYSRAAAFNVGAQAARGDVLILHDNDLLVPRSYAAEVVACWREGWRFIDIKRFVFYLDQRDTQRTFADGELQASSRLTVVQNVRGGSVAATRQAYFEIGGFDEEFVGWGGEDLDFWERATVHGGAYVYGYMPIVHLWHGPQQGKAQPSAPGVQRYGRLREIPPEERIRRLRARQPLAP